MSTPHEKFAADVSKSKEAIEASERRIAERAAAETDETAGAADAETIIAYLESMWAMKEMTPQQRIFSLCLVTINYREGVPASFGGKDMFDRCAAEARAYYDTNKGR